MNNTRWCKKTESANPRLEKIGVECQVLQLFLKAGCESDGKCLTLFDSYH